MLLLLFSVVCWFRTFSVLPVTLLMLLLSFSMSSFSFFDSLHNKSTSEANVISITNTNPQPLKIRKYSKRKTSNRFSTLLYSTLLRFDLTLVFEGAKEDLRIYVHVNKILQHIPRVNETGKRVIVSILLTVEI